MIAILNSKFTRSILMAGTSAIVLGIVTPSVAQETEEDEQRILGAITVTTQKLRNQFKTCE